MQARAWTGRRWLAMAALVLSAGLGARAAAGEVNNEVVIELRHEVLLGGSRMTLADVAEIGAADAAVRRAFGAVVLGRAPMPGYLEQRSRAELDMALRGQALSSGQTIVWRGAASVKVRSATQQLDPARLLELARQRLREAYTDVELDASLATPLPELLAPAGTLQYRARLADPSRPRARMAVWIDVIADGAVYRSVVVPLAVTARRGVYLARRALPAGATATADDFAEARQDVAGLADAALAPGALPHGGRVREALAPGQVVTVRQMAPADMVLRGDRVRLVIAAAGIAIETSALAQADAVVGQRVQVRPERSNELVTARVMAPGVVSVDGQ